ncbi:MAG: GNAT family N-acetyltransferase [Okeania sp. SIO3B3]|nr:GNAT family N-acetyltransferase [Okeania sp. SIO3B3]
MTKRKHNNSAKTLEWHLRRASEQDVDALYTLLCVPEVYHYLCDGMPPPRCQAEKLIELNSADNAANGLGLWLLENDTHQLAGCVSLDADSRPRTGELIYLLHPEYWGQGLATRMSWTVVERVFRERLLDQIIAGADGPNQASIAVMSRLGMKYLRAVRYPLGPGVEYVLRHDDPKSTLLPDLLLLHD